MRPRKEIGRKARIDNPWKLRRKRGDSDQERDDKQATAQQTEAAAEDSVEETQAGCMCGSVNQPAGERDEQEHCRQDQKKRDRLSGAACCRGNAPEDHGEVVVVPCGQQNPGDESREREQLQDDAAKQRPDGGVGEDREQKPVECAHAIRRW